MSALSPREMYLLDSACHPLMEKGIAFLGIAIGQYLASLTGLPIDYQIQRMTEANALHDGARNPLGHRNLDSYKGDAQTSDWKRRLAQLEAEHPGDVLATPCVRKSPRSNGSGDANG